MASNVEGLEEEIDICTTALETENDPVERRKILEEIINKQEQILELSKAPLETRKSTRPRQPTEKMAQLLEDEREKKERKFKKTFMQKYEMWKETSKHGRSKLKGFCTEHTLGAISSSLKTARDEVVDAYEALRQACPPDQGIRRQVDTCVAISKELLKVIKNKEEDADAKHVSSDLQQLLHADENASIFSTRASSRALSHISESASTRRARAAAQVVAFETEIKMLEAKQSKQAELDELQRQQEEMQRLQEKKRREIEQLEKEKELEKARLQFEIFDQECKSSVEEMSTCSTISGAHNIQETRPHHEKQVTNAAQAANKSDIAALAQSLRDCMTLHKLPVPEPSVFTGESIRYTEWKTSFKTLIESRAIAAPEKVYYLKRYLGGEALKAVEGFFYNTSTESYEGAWQLLEERYGHPFKVQKAFRDKLAKWQKIGPKDANGLQQFADFLKACKDAIPHVPALKILSDCEENRRLLSRLPDWAAARWNRQVTQKLDDTGKYPQFEEFVEFVRKEARVACNPISSLHALKGPDAIEVERATRDARTNRNKGIVLATGLTEDQKNLKIRQTPTKSTFLPKPCQFCRKTEHQIGKCSGFQSKSLADRRKFIQENRLCFGCLKKGHTSKECRRKLTCDKCQRRHPTVLHENTASDSPTNAEEKSPKKENHEVATAVSCGVQLGSGCGTSMIVPVWVSSAESPSEEILTYALLDTQSDCTFILDETARSITARCEPVRLKLSTMTSTSSMIQCNAVSNLLVRGMSSSHRIRIPRSYTREFIPIDKSHIPTTDTARRWPHLQSITHELAPLQNCDVGMLIGYNCPQALAPRETLVGSDDEPYAVKTDLGWTIIGYEYPSGNSYATSICHRVSVKEAPPVEISPSNVISALEADFTEKNHTEKAISQEDIKFLNILETGIHQTKSGHYSMPLPFRDGKPMLPNNKKTAMVRLNHLSRKFTMNTEYHSDYKAFMEEVIRKGDAEKVERQGEEGRVWYIPHHGVYHPQKPGKIRVVFDCSARHAGTSLNGHLLSGPDLINNLMGVLCRFREHPIAVVCDIEKMFHQFLVDKDDRDYLRFLWWENGDTSNKPQEYRMKVHLFGAASSPGCANYGLKHLASQQEDRYPLAAAFIKKNFYVDDGLKSTETEEEAKELLTQAQDVCASGGLRLHKFLSNSRAVMEAIPINDRAAGVKEVDLQCDALPTERALGIQWCVETDKFQFQIKARDHPSTRRGILSTVASIYDPLGFLAPFVLVVKQILQEMCHGGANWDDPLPEKLQPRWEKWKSDLNNLKHVEIPRCYRPQEFGKVNGVELHHFSDASTSGYGQCSYLRFIGEDKVHCSLVAAKARVAPVKVVTIPRLELTAAVVSALMSHTLKRELELTIDREYFWTDSRVVLGYISNDVRRFHVFVANRIQKIKQFSDPSQWHYIETKMNPADHASRGTSAVDLIVSNWFRGPEFLWKKELVVPADEPPRVLDASDPEVKGVTSLQTTTMEESFSWEHRLSCFSTWSSVLGAVARLKRVAQGRKHDHSLSTVQERRAAERQIVMEVQKQAFSEEMQTLTTSGRVKSTSKISNLNPFLDSEGILRVGGRLKNAELQDCIKHPAILPKDSQLTRLIVGHFHDKVQHQGRGMTLNEVRANGYWIIGGVKVVATHIHKCTMCRRLRRPVEEQKMADLPKERVEPSPPFTFCGMDCFGPFTVKEGRRELKKYGLLLTCMCSRAVHIEMLDDMTTDSFINALRRFITLRGPVQQLRCDQGSNFVGAKNEFQGALKELDMKRVHVYLAKHQCQFVMNAPHSSHVGGVWERQIKTVRSVLSSIIQQSQGRLDTATLRTFLYEAMAIVNSRPLTPANLQDPLSPEPLTPNHLVTMKSIAALPPPGRFMKEDLYIRKRWRKVQYLAEQFWGRWKREYLASLNQRSKWNTKRRNMKVGDVVLVTDKDTPRMEWPLAIVTEATKDKDGLVRRCKVQMGSKELDQQGRRVNKASILERPIQKLVFLLESE